MIKLEEELKKIDEEKEKEKEEMKEKQEKAKRKSFANGIKSFCIYVPRSKLICICHNLEGRFCLEKIAHGIDWCINLDLHYYAAALV